MNKNLLIVLVLILLVVVSVVQAVQLVSLKSKLTEIQSASIGVSRTAVSSQAAQPSSSGMVGGC